MIINKETIDNYVKGITNPNTQKTYRSSLKKFHKFLTEKEINDITEQNINTIIHDYKAYLNTKKYKAVTVNQHLIILKTFINDYTTIEYTKDLKLLKTTREKPHYLTREQIKTVLKYTDNKTDELIIRLLITTGLRINEAVNLTKQQLTKTDKQGNAIIKIIGKNTKRRIIVLSEKLTKQLNKYSKKHKTYIFESTRNKNKPITTRTIEIRFKKLAHRIDQEEHTNIYSENLKPHNLRHSFAIQALKTNEINYVKEFLGHENIATTQIYTNLKEKDVVERFKNMEII